MLFAPDVGHALHAKANLQFQEDAETYVVERNVGIGVDVYNQEISGEIAVSLTAATGGANTSGPKVLTAGFSFGQSAKAHGIGWQEECAPTLRGGEGGNQKPHVVVRTENETGMTASGFKPRQSAAARSTGFAVELSPTIDTDANYATLIKRPK